MLRRAPTDFVCLRGYCTRRMLDRLNQLYIEPQDPGERGLLPEGTPSEDEAQRFFRFAEDVLAMTRQHVENEGT